MQVRNSIEIVYVKTAHWALCETAANTQVSNGVGLPNISVLARCYSVWYVHSCFVYLLLLRAEILYFYVSCYLQSLFHCQKKHFIFCLSFRCHRVRTYDTWFPAFQKYQVFTWGMKIAVSFAKDEWLYTHSRFSETPFVINLEHRNACAFIF